MLAGTGSPASLTECRRCMLPTAMPGVRLDQDGLCAECAGTLPVADLAAGRAALRAEVEAAITQARGAVPYDAIVAYSGGKDSSYVLKMMAVDHGLRCLAITVENGFLSDGAYANCRAVCGGLGVDHVMFTPDQGFTQRMYRQSVTEPGLHAPAAVKRSSAICSSCITLINTHMIQQAMQHGAGIIAGGYLAGQVPRDGAVMRIVPAQQGRMRAALVSRFTRALGADAARFFTLPSPVGESREIIVVNPMLGLGITEDEIVAQLLPLGWRKPADTGITSTNCRLNDLGVYLHSRKHGFHPYALEIAEQLRHGTLTREEAAHKLRSVPSRDDVAWLGERIGLDADAL